MKHNFAHDSSLIVRTSYLKMTIRPTTYADIDALLIIFSHARKQMAIDGNPTQWGEDYPCRQQLEEDIRRGVSYVLEQDGVVCATFVFVIGEDPTYRIIDDGAWLDDDLPYGTIHRIASDGTEKKVFARVLDWCLAHCNNIRIDTHQANQRMIHLVLRAGFSRCGIIYTRDHSPRIAYQMLKK